MSRKPNRVFTNKFFRIKAKNVKKGDVIHVGQVHMKVHSNVANQHKGRVLMCDTFRHPSAVTLILPRNLKVNVNKSEMKYLKK